MRFLCIGNADSIVMINAQILPTTVYISMYVHKKLKTTSNKGDRCYTQSQYLISLHLKQTLITTRNFSKMSNAYLFDIKVSRYFLRNRIVPFSAFTSFYSFINIIETWSSPRESRCGRRTLW